MWQSLFEYFLLYSEYIFLDGPFRPPYIRTLYGPLDILSAMEKLQPVKNALTD